MLGSCLEPLQEAIHPVLAADANLAALAAAVFDEVPANTAINYVQHGDAHEASNDTAGKCGRIVDFAVEGWSTYRGSKIAKQMANAVILALNGAPLTVSGWVHVRTMYLRTMVTRQPDGISRFCAVWFRAWVEEA